MTCSENETDPLFLRLTTMLDSLCSRVDDAIGQREKEVEECKLKDEKETRFEHEIKRNESLLARRAEVLKREAKLTRACGAPPGAASGVPSGAASRTPALTAGDEARLQKAKEMYQIAKELTGIRWDFSAPPDVAKGYVRSEARKRLEPFELRCDTSGTAGTTASSIKAGTTGAEVPPEVEAALWARLAADKENRAPL